MLTGVNSRIGRICSMHSTACFAVVFSPRAVFLLSPAVGLALQALPPQMQARQVLSCPSLSGTKLLRLCKLLAVCSLRLASCEEEAKGRFERV